MIKGLNMEYTQKMQRCHAYVEALEEERSKIQVFQRELPLCLELVTQAIDACKRALSVTSTENVHGQSECSEQTTGECGSPVLEEFIPIKRPNSCNSDDDDEQESHKHKNNDTISCNSDEKKKSDWLSSVQLWNQTPDPTPKEDHLSKKTDSMDVKRNGGSFQPFQKEKAESMCNNNGCDNNQQPAVPTAAASSTASGGSGDGSGNSGKKEAEKDEGQRKQRRCWSPDLHRRFVNALQQLGGSHVATPKQIRELMKVDGLTNDEVKSHLQKYRLHTRRPSQTVPDNTNPQAPHFVVVGGIWVPQPDYTTTTNAIYTTVAARPPSAAPPQWPRQTKPEPLASEERSGSQSNSPASSSSTRTSPVVLKQ